MHMRLKQHPHLVGVAPDALQGVLAIPLVVCYTLFLLGVLWSVPLERWRYLLQSKALVAALSESSFSIVACPTGGYGLCVKFSGMGVYLRKASGLTTHLPCFWSV
eukprot:jgi/Botrbrau1/6076/Bobra.177_1s0015.1